MAERLDVAEIILPGQLAILPPRLELHYGEASRNELTHAHRLILAQHDWKLKYSLADSGEYACMPAAVEVLAEYLSQRDVIVAKRYGTEANEVGPVYYERGLRRFPDGYFDVQGNGTVDLLTVGGFAVMLTQESGEAERLAVALTPGTRVTFRHNTLHGVSRPLSRAALEHFCATGVLDFSLGDPEPRTLLFGGKME